MSQGKRIPASEMLAILDELRGYLIGTFERCEVAGSLRRGGDANGRVGDGEMVLRPAYDGDMNLLHERLDLMLENKMIEKRLKENKSAIAWKNRYRALLYRGYPIDLFIVLPDRQWGPRMLLSTGPVETNAMIVTRDGTINQTFNVPGILPLNMQFDDGGIWRDGELINAEEEWDVFSALGLPYIEPHHRSPQLLKYAVEKYRHDPIMQVGLELGGHVHYGKNHPYDWIGAINIDGKPIRPNWKANNSNDPRLRRPVSVQQMKMF